MLGNRGIMIEIWNNTGNLAVDDIESLSDVDPGYSSHHLDVATHTERLRSSYLAKMRGQNQRVLLLKYLNTLFFSISIDSYVQQLVTIFTPSSY